MKLKILYLILIFCGLNIIAPNKALAVLGVPTIKLCTYTHMEPHFTNGPKPYAELWINPYQACPNPVEDNFHTVPVLTSDSGNVKIYRSVTPSNDCWLEAKGVLLYETEIY